MERSYWWARGRNADGEDVWFRPARGCAWPIVMLDDLQEGLVMRVARKYSSMVVETSRDNFQIWIVTAMLLSEAQRLAVQRHLRALVGGDAGSMSGEHFGRAPGTRNPKPGREDFMVRVLHAGGGQKFDPSPYLTAAPTPVVPAPRRGRGRVLTPPPGTTRPPPREDESAKEFRFVVAILRQAQRARRDMAAAMSSLERNLTARALMRGKRATEQAAREYAHRTVTKAAEWVRGVE